MSPFRPVEWNPSVAMVWPDEDALARPESSSDGDAGYRRRMRGLRDDVDIRQVTEWVADARRIVALTGAGISTDSVGHAALVEWERAGKLAAIVTQNIDGLHQRAGNSPDTVIEIHGTLYEAECLGCADRTGIQEVLDRVAAGEDDPACRHCAGILKTATISFGQSLHGPTLRRAARAVADCDLMLAVGTSLTVQPAAGLVEIAAESGARVVIINAAPTPYDTIADAVVREPIGTVLPALVSG
ncbi:NAD-dependent deacetylase [Solwaraspora sp. WMMA2080]|uniref:SIR2 family NAD-dependent protein deacylase n=1 Tax=Solwaraspora sp. WMMA2080 TaxID=3015165 RepID=UPI00248ACF3B|nr:Sir2 family NAD-dependent protein deacetylase [Solwaraspora sp. WMMA2080]WBC21375.1 NAD-dependent deacetylase [Solwaraspora sp. WMMA2080]